MSERDINRTRYMGRVGLDLYLRVAVIVGDIFQGDLIRGLIFYAMARANVLHLNQPRLLSPLAEDGLFPDTMRQPVTCYSLAKQLGVPRETVRRHVLSLVQSGHCVQTEDRRYYVPSATLRTPEFSRLSRLLEGELDAAYADLKRSGVILDPPAAS